jgi:hypothetical protein
MERRRSCCSIKKQEYQTIEATAFIFWAFLPKKKKNSQW